MSESSGCDNEGNQIITFDKSAHFAPSLKSLPVSDLKCVRPGQEGTALILCNYSV